MWWWMTARGWTWGLAVAAMQAPQAPGSPVPSLGTLPVPYTTRRAETDADVLERLLTVEGYALGGTWVVDRPIHVDRAGGVVRLAAMTIEWEGTGQLVVHGAPLLLVDVRLSCARRQGLIILAAAPGRRVVRFFCAAA